MGNKDTYFVAVKVFLLDSEGNFLITKDRFGDWDIPGGRLREQDFNVPLEVVVERKMKEEVGEGVKYKLGGPIVLCGMNVMKYCLRAIEINEESLP